jgi:uncharacterized ion transporter superfamily protein YfcC
MFVAGVTIWIAWTLRYVSRGKRSAGTPAASGDRESVASFAALSSGETRHHVVVLLCVLLPMAAYVYGAFSLGWGFNELSAAFVIGGLAAGLVGGLGITRSVTVFLEGMEALLPAALMVGVARSISIVLEDGRVIDTILSALVSPLADMTSLAAGLLMVPFQALIHIAVPSVSGQAVLTMPLFVPMADVLGLSRQVPVLAYQTGAGLMEMATPTNGALMAILLAAGVPYQQWMRFAWGGILLLVAVGVVGLAVV